MSADLQGDVNLKLGNTLDGLSQVRGHLDAIGTTTAKNGRASQDYQKKTEGMLRSIGHGAKEAGHALHEMGGVAGDVANRIGKAAAMSGNFARLAVGVSLAAFAWEAFKKVIEANIERTKTAIEVQKGYNDAIVAGNAAARASAIAGAGQQHEMAALLTSKHPERSEGFARGMENRGVMDASTARKVVALSDRLPENVQAKALKVAETVAMGGGDPMQAMHSIVMFPGFQAQIANGSGGRVANQLFATQTGTRYDSEFSSRAREAYRTNPYLVSARQTQGLLNQQDQARRDFTVQEGPGAASEALGKTASPVSAALAEFNYRVQESIANLDKMAAAQGKYLAFIADLTDPNGSFKTQRQRKQNALDGMETVGDKK